MPHRSHTIGDADQRARQLIVEAGRELRLARHRGGGTLAQAAERLGWSITKVSRMERGKVPGVSVWDLARLGGVVGLRPWLRFFPTGRGLRDVAQVRLLEALNQRLHPSWRVDQEVAMPIAGDLRAADQLISISGCRVMVEAYTRLSDWQAQVRDARRKQRDLRADRLLFVVAATRSNRRAVAELGWDLQRTFPVGPRQVLASLAAGVDPRGDAVLLLRPAREPELASAASKGQRTPAQAPNVAPGARKDT